MKYVVETLAFLTFYAFAGAHAGAHITSLDVSSIFTF